MNRLLIALLALSLSLIVLPACDGDEPEADDEATEEETEEEETAQESQAQRADGDAVAGEFADVLTQIMGFIGKATNFQCECASEMMGFETAEECLAATGAGQEEGMEEFRDCTAQALASGDAPPAGIEDTIACARNTADQVDECFANVRSEHEDICSEEGTTAFQGCFELVESGLDGCMDEDDEEIEAWMDSVDSEMDLCMAKMMGM